MAVPWRRCGWLTKLSKKPPFVCTICGEHEQLAQGTVEKYSKLSVRRKRSQSATKLLKDSDIYMKY